MATNPPGTPPPGPTPYIGTAPLPKMEENRGNGKQQFNSTTAKPSEPARAPEPTKTVAPTQKNDGAVTLDQKKLQGLIEARTKAEGAEQHARTEAQGAETRLQNDHSPRNAGVADQANKTHQGTADELKKAQNNVNNFRPTTPRR